MRKFLLLTILTVTITAGAYAYALFWYIPGQIEKKLTAALENIGFENVIIGNILNSPGITVFESVFLDKDKFSSIEKIKIHYSPLGFFFSGGKAERIDIQNMHLTGEITDKNTVSISGWKNNKELLKQLKHLPANFIIIEDGSISLLSKLFGGITVNIKGQIKNKNKNNLQIIGLLKSKQKKLSFQSKATGELLPDGDLEILFETEEFQTNIEGLRFNRATAQTILTLSSRQPASIAIQMLAGAATWKLFPLRDVNMAVEIAENNLNLFAEGKTIGKENVEFTANITQIGKNYKFELIASPKRLDDVVTYLSVNKIIPQDTKLPVF